MSQKHLARCQTNPLTRESREQREQVLVKTIHHRSCSKFWPLKVAFGCDSVAERSKAQR